MSSRSELKSRLAALTAEKKELLLGQLAARLDDILRHSPEDKQDVEFSSFLNRLREDMVSRIILSLFR